MKILILNAYYYPEKAASIYLEKDVAEFFAHSGNDVLMFVPFPTRGLTKSEIEKYKDIKEEVLCNGKLRIIRYKLPNEGKNPVKRAFRYFLQNAKQYFFSIKQTDIDCIFCGSTPPTQGWVAGKIKKRLFKKTKKEINFVYNLQDVFPDSLVNAGLAKKNSLLWKIGRIIEKSTYDSADKIITISNSMKTNLIEKGVPKEKIEMVYNWVDLDLVHPVSKEQNDLFERFNIDYSKFIVLKLLSCVNNDFNPL